MKHHLTYHDDKSDKFWQIETTGNSFAVTYGKTGTAGISQTKTFDSEEKCLKEAEKLLNEKLKKGYTEGEDATNDYLKSWEEVVNSSSTSKASKEHLIEKLKSRLLDWIDKIPKSEKVGIIVLNLHSNGMLSFMRCPQGWWDDFRMDFDTDTGLNIQDFGCEIDTTTFLRHLAKIFFSNIHKEPSFKKLTLPSKFYFLATDKSGIWQVYDEPISTKNLSLNVELMVTHIKSHLEQFIKKHQEESFYACVIEGGQLMMNSVENHARLLAEYPSLDASNSKLDTGDFYTIIKLDDPDHGDTGYDDFLYPEFYDSSNLKERQKREQAYIKGMTLLLKTLEKKKVFDLLNRTEDFWTRVDLKNY